MSGLMEQATLWAAMLNGSPDEQENSEGEILDMLLARITALEAREAELVAEGHQCNGLDDYGICNDTACQAIATAIRGDKQ